MKERFIKIENKLIPVNEDVYLTYYQMRRKEKGQVEKDQYNGLIHYNDYDSDYGNAEENICSSETSVEEIVDKLINIELLNRCIEKLDKNEQVIVYEIYYLEKSESDVAKQLGIARTTLQSRKYKILKKLKKMMKK
ncbi:MAG: sigma-70 family RNA polymerase sigma factor [Clostridia bacterium]|nr:sigma-70 family RNA polymerase sigma factor [Clostridia bacterium]